MATTPNYKMSEKGYRTTPSSQTLSTAVAQPSVTQENNTDLLVNALGNFGGAIAKASNKEYLKVKEKREEADTASNLEKLRKEKGSGIVSAVQARELYPEMSTTVSIQVVEDKGKQDWHNRIREKFEAIPESVRNNPIALTDAIGKIRGEVSDALKDAPHYMTGALSNFDSLEPSYNAYWASKRAERDYKTSKQGIKLDASEVLNQHKFSDNPEEWAEEAKTILDALALKDFKRSKSDPHNPAERKLFNVEQIVLMAQDPDNLKIIKKKDGTTTTKAEAYLEMLTTPFTDLNGKKRTLSGGVSEATIQGFKGNLKKLIIDNYNTDIALNNLGLQEGKIEADGVILSTAINGDEENGLSAYEALNKMQKEWATVLDKDKNNQLAQYYVQQIDNVRETIVLDEYKSSLYRQEIVTAIKTWGSTGEKTGVLSEIEGELNFNNIGEFIRDAKMHPSEKNKIDINQLKQGYQFQNDPTVKHNVKMQVDALSASLLSNVKYRTSIETGIFPNQKDVLEQIGLEAYTNHLYGILEKGEGFTDQDRNDGLEKAKQAMLDQRELIKTLFDDVNDEVEKQEYLSGKEIDDQNPKSNFFKPIVGRVYPSPVNNLPHKYLGVDANKFNEDNWELQPDMVGDDPSLYFNNAQPTVENTQFSITEGQDGGAVEVEEPTQILSPSGEVVGEIDTSAREELKELKENQLSTSHINTGTDEFTRAWLKEAFDLEKGEFNFNKIKSSTKPRWTLKHSPTRWSNVMDKFVEDVKDWQEHSGQVMSDTRLQNLILNTLQLEDNPYFNYTGTLDFADEQGEKAIKKIVKQVREKLNE